MPTMVQYLDGSNNKYCRLPTMVQYLDGSKRVVLEWRLRVRVVASGVVMCVQAKRSIM